MSTRWAALAAVIIILASSLCIPMAANGSDGDVATGTNANPLESLSVTADAAAGKSFFVRTGGSVSVTPTESLIIDTGSYGYGLTVSQGTLSGTLTSSGSTTINCTYIHNDQTATFTINSVLTTGSSAKPLASLYADAGSAAGKTFYVASGGSVTIDTTEADSITISPSSGSGLTYQSSAHKVAGTLSGTSNVTISGNGSFDPTGDPFTITIVPVAPAGSGSSQTGGPSSPLSGLTASFADAKDKTFYVAVGGSVDLSGNIADWTAKTWTGGYGLTVSYTGDYEHVSGTISKAGTITITVAEGPDDNVKTITIIAVGSGGSDSYVYTLRYWNGEVRVGVQTGQLSQSTGSAIITQPDPTRSGWEFRGWSYTSSGTENGRHYGDSATVTSLMPNDLYASWGRTVTFNPNGGDSMGGNASAVVLEGKTLTLPTATRDGYTFDGWYTSATGGSPVSSPYTPSGNVTLYAHWTQSQSGTTSYTVTFNANGGNVSMPSQTYTGTPLNLPTATWSGHTFQGWYTAATGGSPVSSPYTPTGNVTLYAHWTQGQIGVSYTVTFDANGGATAGGTTTMTYTGAALTLPDATKTGHTFQGWYTALTNGSRVGGAGDSYTPTGNVTLHALWIQNQSGNCTVTFVTHPPGEGTFAVGTAGSGGMPTTNIVTVPRGTTLDNGVGPSGWSFMNQINFSDGHYVICTYDSSQTTLYGWLVDGEALKERTVTVQDDMTVTAMFTALGEAAIAIQDSVTAERGSQNNTVPPLRLSERLEQRIRIAERRSARRMDRVHRQQRADLQRARERGRGRLHHRPYGHLRRVREMPDEHHRARHRAGDPRSDHHRAGHRVRRERVPEQQLQHIDYAQQRDPDHNRAQRMGDADREQREADLQRARERDARQHLQDTDHGDGDRVLQRKRGSPSARHRAGRARSRGNQRLQQRERGQRVHGQHDQLHHDTVRRDADRHGPLRMELLRERRHHHLQRGIQRGPRGLHHKPDRVQDRIRGGSRHRHRARGQRPPVHEQPLGLVHHRGGELMKAQYLAALAAFLAILAAFALPCADAEGEEEEEEETEESEGQSIDWVPIAVAAIGAVIAVIGYRYHPAIVVAGAIIAVFGAAWALGWIDPAGWIDSLTNAPEEASRWTGCRSG